MCQEWCTISFRILVRIPSNILNNPKKKNLLVEVVSQIVAALCKTITQPRLSVVCFDIFHQYLLKYLQSHLGLLSIGTIRSNRKGKCPLLSDKELLKKGRGAVDVKVLDNQIACVKWADNKVVTLASTMTGIGKISPVQRWNKNEAVKVDVECPEIVSKYNSMMGGVDTFDMLLELYRTSTRAHRWYVPIIDFLISLSLVNSWLAFKDDNEALQDERLKTMNSKLFRLNVFEALVSSEKRRGGPPANQPKAKVAELLQSLPDGFSPGVLFQN